MRRRCDARCGSVAALVEVANIPRLDSVVVASRKCHSIGRKSETVVGGEIGAVVSPLTQDGAVIYPSDSDVVLALSNSDRKTTDSGHTEGVVYRITTRLIAKTLKAPSTAKFPSFYDDGAVTFTSLGGNRYKVSSYVDSQNGFGAMLRTHWTATVRVNGDTVSLEDLQTK